jgi:hypothetical protein
MTLSSKEKKFDDVYEAVLAILNSHAGLKGVNHSNVARMSGVSRAWIYKYIGKTREELIRMASEHYSREILKHRHTHMPRSREELKKVIREDLFQFLKQALTYPRVIPLIIMYFDSHDPVGSIVRSSFGEQSRRQAKEIESLLKVSKLESEALAEMLGVFRLALAFFAVRAAKVNPMSAESFADFEKTYQQFLDLMN